MVLFPCKFLEVMIVGFQFMKFLLVVFDPFNIILSVYFSLCNSFISLYLAIRLLESRSKIQTTKIMIVRIYLFRKTGGILSINLNLIIIIQTYNFFFNHHSSDIASVHYLHYV